MKHSMLITCAMALAAVTLNGRLDAAVTSDVVGYQTITLNPGYNLIGATFNGIDGEGMTFDEMLDGEFVDGDAIFLRAEGKSDYDYYSYWSGFGGWLNQDWEKATTPVPPGSSFWIQTPGRSVTVTMKGVVLTEPQTITSEAGIQLVCVGVPVALDLSSDVTWTGLSDGDSVQIRNSEGVYVYYSYWSGFGGWLDENWELSTIPVSAGASFWLTTTNSGVTMTLDLTKLSK